jgi:hypothetical protein
MQYHTIDYYSDRSVTCRHRDFSPVDIIESDVALYRFAGNESVLFMYNLFDQVGMKRMLDHIRNSVRRTPHDIWPIYDTPVNHDAIQRKAISGRCEQYEIGNTNFRVYSRFNPWS